MRADIGGRTHAFTSDCREAGIRFSVGYEVDERVREAIAALPESAWRAAIDGDGTEREGAQVDGAERARRPLKLARGHAAHPPTRASPSRRPALGPRRRGYRHTAFITDQGGDIAAWSCATAAGPGSRTRSARQGDRDAQDALRRL